MKFVIVAGGTGGHIYPGIALAQEIKQRDPSAEILFIGSEEGLEYDLVKRQGFKIKLIKARALLRKISYKAISAPFVSLIGFVQAFNLLKKYKPDAVISTGGYVSLPIVLAAKLLKRPIFLCEQNILAGAVNRLCGRLVLERFLSFPGTKFLKGEVLGNPVRREIIQTQRGPARKSLGYNGEKVVLVMGGSQGSKKMNEVVVSAVEKLPEGVSVLHIVGERDFGWVSRLIEGRTIKNYWAVPYSHDMAKTLAAVDLVVSRAGATAIAEFLVRGLPMVLVPFPYAAEDHQRLNARSIAEHGAARVVENEVFTAEKFVQLVSDTLQNYAKMKQAAAKLAKPEAARKIVEKIYDRI